MNPPEEPPSGFAEDIGVEWIDLDPDNARARIKVEERHLQHNGVVHGGVYASLAESISSASTVSIWLRSVSSTVWPRLPCASGSGSKRDRRWS